MQNIQISINSKNLKTSVVLPSSKSLSNRLLIIKSLCEDDFKIHNLSKSDDTKILDGCLQNIDTWRVFDVNDAGTPLRFLTAAFAISPGNRLLTCSSRMSERPVGPLVDALNVLGAKICYFDKKGFPPLVINGSEIRGGKIAIDAGISSQFISALLLIAPVLPEGLEITLKSPVASAPYIRMTLGLMEHFGIVSEWKDDRIKIKPQKYQANEYTIEADWSAAAFWYEIAALADEAEIELAGLKKDSLQGDAVVAEFFRKLGVQTSYLANSIILTKCNEKAPSLELDFFDVPDMFPAIIASCAALNTSCRFTGIQNLALKESDRVKAMVTELEKFGYCFKWDKEDALVSENNYKPDVVKNIFCNTYNDHRIAMALAPLSLLGFNLSLDNASCVAKSYPAYFDDLQNAGFSLAFQKNE